MINALSEVLVEVRFCGVCHTDLHVHEGHYDIGNGKVLSFAERGIQPPLVMGHEIAGVVAATGPEVEDAPEGPVLVYPWTGCGRCGHCRAGNDNLCAAPAFLGIHRAGGYARHVVVPHPRYLIALDGIPERDAAPLACSGLTVWSAIRKLADLAKSSPVAVIGCGGLGLTAVALLRQMGWTDILAIERSPDARAAALAMGANAAMSLPLSGYGGAPPGAVMDFVGNEATANAALSVLAKGGKYVLVGLFGGELRYPLPLIPVRAISIIGSYVGSLTDLKDYVVHVRTHGLPEIPIEHRPMTEVARTLDDLRDGNVVGRVVLDTQAGP